MRVPQGVCELRVRDTSAGPAAGLQLLRPRAHRRRAKRPLNVRSQEKRDRRGGVDGRHGGKGRLMSSAREKPGAAAGAEYRLMANAIRALAMDAVEKAKSGHPGMPMGMADVATVLLAEAMRFDAADPSWPNRDRFVLSAGHGSMLLYSLLYLTGYPGMEIGELKRFRQLGAKTAGHPEHGHAAGIETTTGPLGQGLANAVGMALSERLLNARLGDDVIDHHTYVIAGDGPTSLSVTDDQVARFKACGWNAVAIDGHDRAAISAALANARADASKPWLIACKTTIGYGAPTKAGKSSTHG